MALMHRRQRCRAGHRIGYGGGYYDRFLAEEPDHPTLALCYGFQMLDYLETEEHDIPAAVNDLLQLHAHLRQGFQ